MVFKPRAEFENLETRCAEKHAFVFGCGPMITNEDDRRGLILAANRHDFMSEFCTNIIRKSDNNSTDKPRKLLFSNYATRELLKAGNIFDLSTSRLSPVYSNEEIIKAAYPKWRHASEVVKMHWHQIALRKMAEESALHPYAFTVKLSPTLGKQVIRKGGSSYLHERLSLELKRSLGRKPLMWLILEAVKTQSNHNIMREGKGPIDRSEGLLHVHGAIALDSKEVPIIKRVVRDMNGSSNPVFNNQEIRLNIIKDDAYWVEYCNKHRILNLMFLNGLKRYSRSKSLAGAAEELYTFVRQNKRKLH